MHVLRVELVCLVDRVRHEGLRQPGVGGEGEDEGFGLVGLVLLLLGLGRGRGCRGGGCALGILAHGGPVWCIAVGSKYGVGSLVVVVVMVVVMPNRNGGQRFGQFHRGDILHGGWGKCGVLDECLLSEDLHIDGRRLYDHWTRCQAKARDLEALLPSCFSGDRPANSLATVFTRVSSVCPPRQAKTDFHVTRSSCKQMRDRARRARTTQGAPSSPESSSRSDPSGSPASGRNRWARAAPCSLRTHTRRCHSPRQ